MSALRKSALQARLAELRLVHEVMKTWPYLGTEATTMSADELAERRGNSPDGGSYYHRHGNGALRAKKDGMESFGNDVMPGSRMKAQSRNRVAKEKSNAR